MTSFQDVFNQAATNPEFREKLKKDPKKVLAEECDIHFDQDTTITVVEAKLNTLYIILLENKRKIDLENEIKNNPKNPLLAINLRSMQEPEFRERLKLNPQEVLIKEYNAPLSAEYSVEILEQTEKRQYLVLPQKGDQELSEPELAEIAGGFNAAVFFLKMAVGVVPAIVVGIYEGVSGDKRPTKEINDWIVRG